MIRLLIDEHLSPRLVRKLADLGVFAQHLAHLGQGGKLDPQVWRYAYEHDQIIVTTNARDFLALAAGVALHPGLIVVRQGGLTVERQWAQLAPLVQHLLAAEVDLVNQVAEIWSESRFEIRPLPGD